MDFSLTYSKRGYLNEDFRLFHLKDNEEREFEYHYHEFDKIVVFVSGSVKYIIEGTAYPLRPWDILLLSDHLIHKAVIDKDEPYERYIIYISREFVEKNGTEATDLLRCFKMAAKERMYLIRPDKSDRIKIRHALERIEESEKETDFASDVLNRAMFLQMMVDINRSLIKTEAGKPTPEVESDSKIADVLEYINENLSDELSVDSLAARSFLSKYYFMRRFKEMTGYTVHNYILQKRTMYATELIKNGVPATKAAIESGFCDYSAFFRSFKKMHKTVPRQFKQG